MRGPDGIYNGNRGLGPKTGDPGGNDTVPIGVISTNARPRIDLIDAAEGANDAYYPPLKVSDPRYQYSYKGLVAFDIADVGYGKSGSSRFNLDWDMLRFLVYLNGIPKLEETTNLHTFVERIILLGIAEDDIFAGGSKKPGHDQVGNVIQGGKRTILHTGYRRILAGDYVRVTIPEVINGTHLVGGSKHMKHLPDNLAPLITDPYDPTDPAEVPLLMMSAVKKALGQGHTSMYGADKSRIEQLTHSFLDSIKFAALIVLKELAHDNAIGDGSPIDWVDLVSRMDQRSQGGQDFTNRLATSLLAPSQENLLYPKVIVKASDISDLATRNNKKMDPHDLTSTYSEMDVVSVARGYGQSGNDPAFGQLNLHQHQAFGRLYKAITGFAEGSRRLVLGQAITSADPGKSFDIILKPGGA